ncbi:MAG: hypothetical protein FLDDKLPJ_01008 [Phycisphaerae bacterium]|nr:hypothetical protein [Planctomycetia bacterium]MCG3130254.1 hypothetical protein [Phycisphaerae bacterium]GIK16301.1 MAG: hypothetical protein BroJett003_12650 [Planctomycetota bacterium]MCK6464284.1 hypothetical protein [Phycisphaerae bacterium]MCL4717876.1 hypothetical protein [Phycisphaerae bacterium]
MSDRPTSFRPESDVYSVLLIVATVVVLSGTAFLLMRCQQLFGSLNPFGGA